MALGIFHYQVLHKVLENIHFIHDETELAETILNGMSEALNAEAGSLFKIAPNGTISILAAYGAPIDALRKNKFETGKGVVGWVAQYSQALKVDKPAQDPRFTGAIDSSTGFKTRSILAAPIMIKGRIIGVIEFLNRKGGPFAGPDLDLVSMVGREIGIAFENARLFLTVEASRAFQNAFADSIPIGVLIIDQNGRLLRTNPIAERLLGIEPSEESQTLQKVNEVFKAFPPLIDAAHDVLAADAPISRHEISLTLAGKPTVVNCSGIPIADRNGKRWGSALLLN